MILLLALLTFTLSWNSAPMDSFTLQRADTLDYRIWDRPPVCTIERPCDSIAYSPQVATVEQIRVVGNKAGVAYPSPDVWTVLTLDWSQGNDMPSTFDGHGGMGCAWVKVLLPSPRWTVLYSFQGAVPVFVRATCDHDLNHDGIVNLSDFIPWATWWKGPPQQSLSELSYFGKDYQRREVEWKYE